MTFLRVLPDAARNARPPAARISSFRAEQLEIRMFYVGHGELNLVVFPDRRAWIVEVGSGNGWADNDTLGGLIAGYLASQNLTLDALVMDHAHKDHVGAVPAPAGNRRLLLHLSIVALSQREHLLEPHPDGFRELVVARRVVASGESSRRC